MPTLFIYPGIAILLDATDVISHTTGNGAGKPVSVVAKLLRIFYVRNKRHFYQDCGHIGSSEDIQPVAVLDATIEYFHRIYYLGLNAVA